MTLYSQGASVQFIHIRAHTGLMDEHSLGRIDWRIW
jgi:hypothetical protein